MSFGNKVTDFLQASVGLYGYTLKIDVRTLLFNKVGSVQAQKNPNDTFAPVESEVNMNVIQGYLNDVNSPRLAFNFGDGQCTIFFKGDGSNIPTWTAATSYAIGDVVKSVAGLQHFKCTTAGVSGAVEAIWSETANTTDGTAVWQFVSAIPIADSFPFVAATRFSMFGLRNAQDADTDSTVLDFPDKDLQLVLDYALQLAWSTVKKTVPDSITTSITKEESRVRND